MFDMADSHVYNIDSTPSTCDTTHSHVQNSTFTCVSWLIHTSYIADSNVWRYTFLSPVPWNDVCKCVHDSFICLPCHTRICDMPTCECYVPNSHMWRAAVKFRNVWGIFSIQHTFEFRSRLRHDAFIRVFNTTPACIHMHSTTHLRHTCMNPASCH